MQSNPVYLDYNATTPVRPAAVRTMAAALGRCGNPSSVHAAGRGARLAIETARAAVASLVNVPPRCVMFTSGGTEANNTALARREPNGRVLASAIEHDSILALDGVATVPVSQDGIIDLGALDDMLAAEPGLVSVMLANNETGVIQPLRDVVRLAREHGARVHCDAVQAAGKIAVDMAALGVDMMSLSAHKLGGPQGVGALIVADDDLLRPMLRGGGQERGRRAGTENVAGIVGFGAAAEAADPLVAMERVRGLRDGLESRVCAIAPEAVIHGARRARLPNTSCISLPGARSDIQVMALDLDGIAVSAGSACSSGTIAPSHVLRAMGFGEAMAASAIRVSLGWASTADDVERFVASWSAMRARLCAEAA